MAKKKKESDPPITSLKNMPPLPVRAGGMYSKVQEQYPELAESFETVAQYAPGEVLLENFYFIQARVLQQLSASPGKDAQVVIQACQLLAEEGQISQDFARGVRQLFSKISTRDAVAIYNQTSCLAEAGHRLSQNSQNERQVGILSRFLIKVIQLPTLYEIKRAAVQVVEELKLSTGADVSRMISAIQAYNRIIEMERAREELDDENE